MNLQTQIQLKQHEHKPIEYSSKLLLLGSCFSENIGHKFKYFKFQSLSNPFGVLFHPKAIETLVVKAINEKEYVADDVFYFNEQWHCFDAHSQLSHASKDQLLKTLNSQLALTRNQIIASSHIVITLGTAWVYSLLETKKLVANCHKRPQKEFSKLLLSIEEITQSLETIIKAVQSVNVNTTVVFTVSPVRHIKDGFEENTLSKSHLIAAIHSLLSNKEESDNICYFPSFEIVMDELRDYRFYKKDMLHPNETAIDYIWEKFSAVWFASKTVDTLLEVDAVQKALQHKPFNAHSAAHQKFLENLELKKANLALRHPHFKF